MNCLYCGEALTNPKAKYCSDAHKKAFTRKNKLVTPVVDNRDNNRDKEDKEIIGTTDNPNMIGVVEEDGTIHSHKDGSVIVEHEHGPNTWYVANCLLCYKDILIESEKIRAGWV